MYRGLSTDTKPTTNVLTNSLFIETDTGVPFIFTSGAWASIQANISGAASMTVYRSAGNTKVRNNITGQVVHSSVDATDSSPAFNYAIANMPTSAVSGDITYKGRINVLGGVYNCKTLIDIDGSVLGYHGVELEGEGRGTRLDFTPAGAITDAIRLKMSRPRIANMRIYGNANVTNLLHILALAPNIQYNYRRLENLDFDGSPYNTGSFESGLVDPNLSQRGIFLDGSTAPPFHNNISGCNFRGLGIGIYCHDQYGNSTEQFNNTFLMCDVAEKINSGQHNFANFWIQGSETAGRYGLWFIPEGVVGDGSLGAGASASINHVVNIQTELHKTNTECAGICIEPGFSGTPQGNIKRPSNMQIVNVRNSYSDSQYWFSVLDKTDTQLANFSYQNYFVPRVSKTKNRVGSLCPGFQTATNADGILRGNVTEFTGGTGAFAFINLANGLARQFSTGTTINSIIGYYGSFASGGRFNRSANPSLRVRFMPSTLTNPGRLFIGLWDQFAAPIAADDILNTPRNGVGLWNDTSVSNDWKVMHNDGVGASTVSALSTVSQIAANIMYLVEIRTDDTDSKFHVTLNSVQTTVTSNIPATATSLGFLIYWENDTAAQRQMWIHDIELETIK